MDARYGVGVYLSGDVMLLENGYCVCTAYAHDDDLRRRHPAPPQEEEKGRRRESLERASAYMGVRFCFFFLFLVAVLE